MNLSTTVKKCISRRLPRLLLLVCSVFLLTFHLSAADSLAAQAALSWTAPTTYTDGTPLTTLAGYKVYVGTASGSYSQNIDVGNTTGYTLGNLNDGTTYYFAVTAYDTSGDVSGFSNQATYTTPAAPPSSALYTLSASVGSGGSISPSGATVVSQGASQTFAITPASGYQIAGVTVDGASVGAVPSYTFSNVATNHTIAVAFAVSTSTSNSITSSAVWQNQSFASQNGVFTAGFDMVPNAAGIDAVTMLSGVAAAAYTDGAVIVRFNTTGTIDARNGSAYAAAVSVPYTAGSTYHVRMVVNVPQHVYDVYVTPPGGSEITLATGYSFRPEQATASVLNNLAVYASPGSHTVLNFALAAQAGPPPVPTKGVHNDFDGDGKADIAVFRPSEGKWYIINSATNTTKVVQWGTSGDIPVSGDFDGDGKTDIAVFRPSEGNWYIINSATNTTKVVLWGAPGDIPVPGDYDGDGKTDIAVFRPSEGNWYIMNSASGTTKVVRWGVSGDIPVPGDYDGDGKTDIAVFRPSEGNWYIMNSATGTTKVVQWGASGDIPAPGDYDGDGKTDIAIWRPSNGTWYIMNSATNTTKVVQWGVSGDVPVPGEYDGSADMAVWRPSNGNWYITNSASGTQRVVSWGVSTDQAVK